MYTYISIYIFIYVYIHIYIYIFVKKINGLGRHVTFHISW